MVSKAEKAETKFRNLKQINNQCRFSNFQKILRNGESLYPRNVLLIKYTLAPLTLFIQRQRLWLKRRVKILFNSINTGRINILALYLSKRSENKSEKFRLQNKNSSV